MAQAIKAVLFDIGGVIVDDRALRQRALDLLVVTDPDSFWTALNEGALPACRGEESFACAWQRVGKLLGIEVSPEIAESLWITDYGANIKIDYEVLSIVDHIRGQVRTGVISNTVAEHAQVLRELGVYDHFDEIILSHEVGMTKDSESIFDLALNRFQLDAQSVAFVDDVERFRAVAATRGMQAILYEDAARLRSALHELGFRMPGH